jgi:hypothetical protein
MSEKTEAVPVEGVEVVTEDGEGAKEAGLIYEVLQPKSVLPCRRPLSVCLCLSALFCVLAFEAHTTFNVYLCSFFLSPGHHMGLLLFPLLLLDAPHLLGEKMENHHHTHRLH